MNRRSGINNKLNVISENFKKFRAESGLSQKVLCEKLELIGLNLYKADKRCVKDYELLAFSIVFNKPIADFYKDVNDFS